LSYFPKPFYERAENAARNAANRGSSWFTMFIICFLIGLIVGGVYYYDRSKQRQGGLRNDPYSRSVIEEK
jgi:hypothetical protein